MKYRKQLDSCFLKQREQEIRYQANLFKRSLLNKLLREVAAQVLCVVDQEVGYLDGLVRMQGSLLMLVHL